MPDNNHATLTRDHRRLLGVAIAMAHADGVVESSEKELISSLTAELGLGDEAKAEVQRMMENPPRPEDIARWCVTPRDRIDVYAAAISMAEADGRVVADEQLLLQELVRLLQLGTLEIEQAKAIAKGHS